jgi:hypothetical protein
MHKIVNLSKPAPHALHVAAVVPVVLYLLSVAVLVVDLIWKPSLTKQRQKSLSQLMFLSHLLQRHKHQHQPQNMTV